MKNLMAITLMGLFAFNSFASTIDVKPAAALRSGDAYVRVTKVANNSVTFEKCLSGYEATTCSKLGNKSSYTLDELRTQRNFQIAKVGLVVISDAAIIAAGGVLAGGTVTALAGIHAILGPLAATAGGLIGGTVVVAAVKSLSPAEKIRQVKSLSNDVIEDQDVIVASNEMDAFIQRLDKVLSNI